MMNRPYPTARDAGTDFRLELYVGGLCIYGDSVPIFLISTLSFIENAGALGKITMPFYTSGRNFLLAASPEQKGGRAFPTFRSFEPKDGAATIYVNTNHPRFFALRQGARLLEAAGLPVSYNA